MAMSFPRAAFLAVLGFTCCLIVLVISAPEESILNGESDSVPREVQWFTVANLRKYLGGSRNLTHSQTRRMYMNLVKDIENFMSNESVQNPILSGALQDSKADATKMTEKERAITCHAMRRVVKAYSRSRDGDEVLAGVTDLELQVRDAYVHGLRYLPSAIATDASALFSGTIARPTRTGMLLSHLKGCLFPSNRTKGCPSYYFLKEFKGKSDKDISRSCTTTNKFFDQIASNSFDETAKKAVDPSHVTVEVESEDL